MVRIKKRSQLNRVLKDVLKESLIAISEKSKDIVENELDKHAYSNKPSSYKRTNQLKDSLTNKIIENKNSFKAKIFHDTDKIKPIPPSSSNNYMGQHYSTATYRVKEYQKYIVETINNGTSGKIFGSGYWTQKRPYFTESKKNILKNYSDMMKTELNSKKLKVRR
ncbi:hypothetical protein B7C51_25230 (plasmid) [Paenibacillus larvae subsp. pulvifaciens]|uniref:Uncharacterized protein n=1 Tax=Paenibacillus larvae subsp. pulvifaciens TaxID=1477 RepID=A0A1V0V046_9BACL|nr:hypothetical protein [Paenibacillus larvae]ARF70776.1 hypothetical protein B7C51_25230 [Paenibacillus larvae subsp. pulvifaciens]